MEETAGQDLWSVVGRQRICRFIPNAKRFTREIVASIFILGWLICLPVSAIGQTTSSTNVLIVGTGFAPPFAMKRQDGSWEGISIDLWRRIADQLHLQYEFREMPLNAMIGAVASNRIDVAVAAITITADRQQRADFTHSYYTSGLAIGVRRAANENHLFGILRSFLSGGFLEIVFAVLFVMVAAGTTVWYFERKANSAQFGGTWWQGVGSGIWWSAAAITTTGYGDKAPRTFVGRVLAVFWMFAGLVIIASFTAAVTASLTVKHFTQLIQGFGDLPHHRVAVITGTTSETYLRQRQITVVRYPSGEAALRALVDGRVDAFVNDTPVLLYEANQMRNSVEVLQQTFDPQGYGIALPAGSPLYRPIDIALLETISDPAWQEILDKYLSSQEK